MFFSPKMVLTEALPTEVGVEHYGIPKEQGQVTYERSRERTTFEVRESTNQWIMRASVPNTRGLLARWRFRFSLARAFGLGAILRLASKKELSITLAGSAKLCAKNALSVRTLIPRRSFCSGITGIVNWPSTRRLPGDTFSNNSTFHPR